MPDKTRKKFLFEYNISTPKILIFSRCILALLPPAPQFSNDKLCTVGYKKYKFFKGKTWLIFLMPKIKLKIHSGRLQLLFGDIFDYFNFFGTDLQIRSEFSKLEKQNDMIEQIDQFVLKKFALEN